MTTDIASGSPTLMQFVTRFHAHFCGAVAALRDAALAPRCACTAASHSPGPPPEPTRVTLAQLAAFNGEKAVVFFAPEAGVVPHYMAHCLVAKTLKERGHRVLIVRCFDVYPRCVVMDAAALAMEPTEQERLAVCASCRQSANNMAGAYGLDVLDLPDLIDDEARNTVDRLMANLPEDISSFEFEGARLGQFCSAMAAVTFKVTDFTGADPAVRSLMVKYLRGSLLSYLAVQRLTRIIGIDTPYLLQPVRNPDGGGSACRPPCRSADNQSVACNHPCGGSAPSRFYDFRPYRLRLSVSCCANGPIGGTWPCRRK